MITLNRHILNTWFMVLWHKRVMSTLFIIGKCICMYKDTNPIHFISASTIYFCIRWIILMTFIWSCRINLEYTVRIKVTFYILKPLEVFVLENIVKPKKYILLHTWIFFLLGNVIQIYLGNGKSFTIGHFSDHCIIQNSFLYQSHNNYFF